MTRSEGSLQPQSGPQGISESHKSWAAGKGAPPLLRRQLSASHRLRTLGSGNLDLHSSTNPSSFGISGLPRGNLDSPALSFSGVCYAVALMLLRIHIRLRQLPPTRCGQTGFRTLNGIFPSASLDFPGRSLLGRFVALRSRPSSEHPSTNSKHLL